MQQADFSPGDCFTDYSYRTDSKYKKNYIHSCNLNQHRNQLFGEHSFAADRMSQQKFRRFVLFFFTENADCTNRSIKRTAQPQNIAALNSIKPYKRSEIQTVHTECLGKRTHRGKHIVDALHLSFHFREQENADGKQKAHRSCPYQKRGFALPQFVFYKCHTVSPSFS